MYNTVAPQMVGKHHIKTYHEASACADIERLFGSIHGVALRVRVGAEQKGPLSLLKRSMVPKLAHGRFIHSHRAGAEKLICADSQDYKNGVLR